MASPTWSACVTTRSRRFPEGAEGSECDYLLGLGDADGRRLILVDIDKLMSIRREEANAIAQHAFRAA
jgi:hypothetical protein